VLTELVTSEEYTETQEYVMRERVYQQSRKRSAENVVAQWIGYPTDIRLTTTIEKADVGAAGLSG
jgi:hypothetical protein